VAVPVGILAIGLAIERRHEVDAPLHEAASQEQARAYALNPA
jgi:hypothetical protein